MILILQHRDESVPGSTLLWLEQNQLEYQVFHFQKNTLSDLAAFKTRMPSAVFICGGGMNVDEEEKFPWMTTEKKMVKTFLENKVPMVGLCLGSQLIAEALGAPVKAVGHWEVGFQTIRWQQDKINRAKLSDEVRRLFSEPLPVFQFHAYGFTTTENFPSIAVTEASTEQMYFYDQHAVGFQFHPEATWKWIMESMDDEYPREGQFVQSPRELREQAHLQKKMQAWYFKFLDLWLRPQLIRGKIP